MCRLSFETGRYIDDMKRALAILIAFILCMDTAHAAQWPDGTSPAQPCADKPEVDLETTMGYMLMAPGAKNPAQTYCDTLYIYLPRQDVALGGGSLRVNDKGGVVTEVRFDDAQRVKLEPIDDATLDALMWGEGVCVRVWLPVSLPMGEAYVTLDDDCLTAAGGKVTVKNVDSPEDWPVAVQGDYGVGRLRFTGADGAYTATPAAGDSVSFDLMLGGEAVRAAVESGNDTIACPEGDAFDASGKVTLRLTGDDFRWTVVFLNAAGEIVDYIDFDRAMVER